MQTFCEFWIIIFHFGFFEIVFLHVKLKSVLQPVVIFIKILKRLQNQMKLVGLQTLYIVQQVFVAKEYFCYLKN